MAENEDKPESTEEENLYAILGLEPGASQEEIKSAYKRRAAETHPDKQHGLNDAFLKVSKAYTILSDMRSRLHYDKTGQAKEQNASNLRAQAIREVQSLLLQILDGSDDTIFTADLPAKVLGIIQANIEQSKNNIRNTRKRIERLRRYKKRFKFNNKDRRKQDIIAIGIASQIHMSKASVYSEIEKIDVFKAMLEILADYDYEPEITHAFSMVQSNTTITNNRR
jgi:curved DNA-binding protein CbpA